MSVFILKMLLAAFVRGAEPYGLAEAELLRLALLALGIIAKLERALLIVERSWWADSLLRH